MGSKGRGPARTATIAAPSEGRLPTLGKLMVIGGHEEKNGESVMLQEVATVLGSGAVYVADAREITYTNVAEEAPDRTLSIFDVRLHVLSQGDEFSLVTRRPTHHFASSAENGRPKP